VSKLWQRKAAIHMITADLKRKLRNFPESSLRQKIAAAQQA
jgi:hypothetical protein